MKKKPNILFILTDQQRLSTLSCYEQTQCIAPNMNRLAKEGILFKNAYTVCPLCSPARATIMTGLYPMKHGVTNNVHCIGSGINELPDCDVMLPRKLKNSGYKCGYTGKWHLGTDKEKEFIYDNKPSLPKNFGFDGQNFPGHGGGGFYFPEYKEYLKENGYEHGVKETFRVGNGYVPSFGVLKEEDTEATVPYFLAKHTMELIDKYENDGDEPFFIWHNFWGPHEPYYVPEKYIRLYDDISIPEWPNYRWDAEANDGTHTACINPSYDSLEWEEWEKAIKHYYAFTTLIDEQIGRIIDHLEEKGLLEDTIIIFTADHGETLGSHGGLMDKGLFHFEEIQRIPFIMRLPNKEKAGESYSELVSLLDVYPTVLDIAGAHYNKQDVQEHASLDFQTIIDIHAQQNKPDVQGLSLLDLLEGKTNWREDLVIESEGVQSVCVTLRTLIHNNWKYCFTFGHEEQLYNLKEDPYEMHNVTYEEKNRDILNDMRTRLEKWIIYNCDPILWVGYQPYIMKRGYQPIIKGKLWEV